MATVKKIKKAQSGKEINASDSALKYNRLSQRQIDTLQRTDPSSKLYKEVNTRLRGSTKPNEKKWMDVATGRKSVPKQKNGGKTMMKRADGSTSQRGLWDNIRSAAKKNKAAGKPGKKPTSAMLKQEKKIKSQTKNK